MMDLSSGLRLLAIELEQVSVRLMALSLVPG